MTEAELILQKALAGSSLDSRQWNYIQAELRNRAFFSSRIAEVNILSALRSRVAQYAEGGTDISKIRMLIRSDLEKLNYSPEPGEEGTIHDLFSQARLDTIIKTNVAQARGYIQYLEGMSPGAFEAFPAQEFIRVRHSRQPRGDWPQRWHKAGGQFYDGRMIALKTDPVWEKLSVFGNPFPPFDWGSGMGVVDVDRKSAVALGLPVPDKGSAVAAPSATPSFNKNLQAAVPNLRSDSLCGQILKRDFQDQISIENNVVKWQGNLIQEVLSGTRDKARLGLASKQLLEKMSAVAPKEDVGFFRKMNPTFNSNTFLDHASKHLGENERRLKDNIPCNPADYELMPSVWHNPDRVVKVKEHHYVLELETLDEGFLQLAVNAMRGFSSFYKTKRPLGAASGNAPGIP